MLSCFIVINANGRDTLSLPSYLEVIAGNYPLIKKANLYDQISDAYALKGQGVFDPKISSNYQSKEYSGTDYFTVWQTKLDLPTSLPVDFSVGYERNDGVYLNSENTVPQDGLVYGTFSLNLLRGFMFDSQRYNLRSAELKGVKSQIEKDLLTREIFYQAVVAYLEWSGAQVRNDILTNYLQAVQERHMNIIALVDNGDKPSIDTIESRLILNTANKMLLESEQHLNTQRQKVALFLWNEEGEPLALRQTVQPEQLETTIDQVSAFAELLNPNFANDPLLRKIENEIDQIEIKRRLEKQNLLPQIDLKYNAIVTPGNQTIEPAFSLNNYKYGLSVEVPILNRKTKGEVRLNDYQMEQSRLDYEQYRQNLMIKYENLLLNKILQRGVIDVENERIQNCQTLYQAETIKFELGESSVFMLNQRERTLLDARMDLAKGYLQFGKTITDLYYLKLGQL
jgi:outer membrane protein TolC